DRVPSAESDERPSVEKGRIDPQRRRRVVPNEPAAILMSRSHARQRSKVTLYPRVARYRFRVGGEKRTRIGLPRNALERGQYAVQELDRRTLSVRTGIIDQIGVETRSGHKRCIDRLSAHGKVQNQSVSLHPGQPRPLYEQPVFMSYSPANNQPLGADSI